MNNVVFCANITFANNLLHVALAANRARFVSLAFDLMKRRPFWGTVTARFCYCLYHCTLRLGLKHNGASNTMFCVVLSCPLASLYVHHEYDFLLRGCKNVFTDGLTELLNQENCVLALYVGHGFVYKIQISLC